VNRWLLTAFLCVLACSRAGAHDPITSRVTWDTDVARLVQARCVRCHHRDGPAPMPLTTYAEARPWAKAIREEVLTRRMPKWHAARGYGQFENDPSLSAFEIALFVAWVDGGAPLHAARGNDARLKPSATLSGSVARAGSVASESRTIRCGSVPVTGTLLAVKPELAHGESAAITARFPDGRSDIVAWIRDFDPEFAETYRLRTPLVLPRGSRLVVDATQPCKVIVTVR
jgi:hypothetical protein